MRQATFLFASLLVAAIVSLAAEPKADANKGASTEQMTYTAPAGWEKSEQERMTIFTPPGVPPTTAALIVTQGQNLDGDFLKWFKAKWDALRKGDEVVQGGERTGQDGPSGSSVLYQAALLEGLGAGGARRQTGMLLYAVHVGSGVHWVVFRTSGPEPFNKYKKTVNKFLAGLKFVESVPAETREKGTSKPKGKEEETLAPGPKAKPQRGLRIDE